MLCNTELKIRVLRLYLYTFRLYLYNNIQDIHTLTNNILNINCDIFKMCDVKH